MYVALIVYFHLQSSLKKGSLAGTVLDIMQTTVVSVYI